MKGTKINLNTCPAIKRSYTASVTQSGSLFIGVTPEDTVELEINASWISDLLCSLDGGRTILDIVGGLKQKGYSVSTEEVMEQVEALFEAGVLENPEEYALALQSKKISQEDAIRYDRQLLLFQTVSGSYENAFEVQKRLKDATVTLIGIGGVGSYAFFALTAMGVGKIRVVEFDKVEITNLSRQILFREQDVGRKKIDVAKEQGPLINSSCQFEFFETMVDNIEEAKRVMAGSDLVIVAADIPRGIIWPMLNDAAFEVGTPVLYTGSAQTWVTSGPLIVPNKTPCYRCCQPEVVHDDHPVVKMVKNRYTTALIDPYNAIGASIGVLEAVKFLTNFQPCRVLGSTLFVNLGTYETHMVPGEIKSNCNHCNTDSVSKNFEERV